MVEHPNQNQPNPGILPPSPLHPVDDPPLNYAPIAPGVKFKSPAPAGLLREEMGKSVCELGRSTEFGLAALPSVGER